MSGLSEILLLVVIVLVVFMLPRMLNKKSNGTSPRPAGRFRLTGGMRLAILVSVIWPGLMALFLKPWNGNRLLFICLGVLPVALIWGISWVFIGFKKNKD